MALSPEDPRSPRRPGILYRACKFNALGNLCVGKAGDLSVRDRGTLFAGDKSRDRYGGTKIPLLLAGGFKAWAEAGGSVEKTVPDANQ